MVSWSRDFQRRLKNSVGAVARLVCQVSALNNREDTPTAAMLQRHEPEHCKEALVLLAPRVADHCRNHLHGCLLIALTLRQDKTTVQHIHCGIMHLPAVETATLTQCAKTGKAWCKSWKSISLKRCLPPNTNAITLLSTG